MFYLQFFLVMEQINHRTRGASISFQDQIDNLSEQINQLAGTRDNVSILYLKAFYSKNVDFRENFTNALSLHIYCLLNEKKCAQKVWSKEMLHEKTFRISSRTPHAYSFLTASTDIFITI